MRIEVAVAGENPRMVPLIAPLTIVGSSEKANIVLPSSAGVSRKHLQLDKEGEKVYATDLGSTNGTFLNDERLTPGKRIEFTTFFPLKLGIHVTLTLLEDDEGPSLKSSLSATTSSNPDATNPQRTIVAPRARPVGARPKIPKKKPESKSSSSNMLLIVGLLIGVGYWYMNQEEDITVAPVAPVQSEKRATAPRTITKPEAIAAELVPANEYPEAQEFTNAFGEIKCATDFEKSICDASPDIAASPGGVVETIKNVFVLAPEEAWFPKVSEILNEAQDNQRFPISNTYKTLILFAYALDATRNVEYVKTEKNIFFVFYRKTDSRPAITALVAIRPSQAARLIELLPNDFLFGFQDKGETLLKSMIKHFSILKPTSTDLIPRPEPKATDTDSEEPAPDNKDERNNESQSPPQPSRSQTDDDERERERERNREREREQKLKMQDEMERRKRAGRPR